MHPGFIAYWRTGRCGERAAADWGFCGPHREARGASGFHAAPEDAGEPFGFGFGFGHFGGGAFGVRRPLRFLAYKLELDEAQVAELARILDALKTERAQSAVDHRRAISAFAEAIEGAAFDQEKATAGAAIRQTSAQRMNEATLVALQRLHALLQPPQREHLAYLIRSGAVTL